MNNYKTDADGQAVLTTSMPRINQRYGTGLMGLEHMKGRAGVLEYAYNANMLPVLYEHLSPALIRSMRQIAKQKNMPDAEQEKMFNAYAKQCTVYARGIRILQDIPQLSENIQNLLAIENDLALEDAFLLKICSVLNKTGTTKIWRARLKKISNKAPYAPNSCVPA